MCCLLLSGVSTFVPLSTGGSGECRRSRTAVQGHPGARGTGAEGHGAGSQTHQQHQLHQVGGVRVKPPLRWEQAKDNGNSIGRTFASQT